MIDIKENNCDPKVVVWIVLCVMCLTMGKYENKRR